MRLLLIICTSAIFAIGLVMIFSTTSAEVLDHDLQKSPYQALLKQILYALGGLLLAYGAYKFGTKRFLELSPYLLAIFSILLVLTLVPGIGKAVNGSRRWLSLGGFSFQPSEFVKYIIPAFFINRFMQYDQQEWTLKQFLKLVGIPAIPILLIMVEPNNGTAAVIAAGVVVLCLLTQIPFKYWAVPLMFLALIGGVFAYNLPYVAARVKVYLNPELDLKGKGHQPYQAKIAAGSGGLVGRGPGNSLQKMSYLPEAQNDYIAAIYAEEFGFIGILGLICLYAMVACLGYRIAIHSVDRSQFYLAGAITFLICFQAFLNLGVVSGLLPSTGLNLPFFSQGGSSLMANIMGVGLLLSIASRNVQVVK